MEKKSKCCGEEMRWVDEFLCCARCGKETTPQPTEESLREAELERVLIGLHNLSFIKSTNSITDEEEILHPVVQDMEATIRISGEFDREDLKDLFSKKREDFKHLLSHSDIPDKTLAEILNKLK